MSNLVNHARVELEKIESDPWIINGMLKVVQAFADMGHSGGSASVCIPMLNDLLQFKNLSPLTDDPDEWIDQTALTATPDVTLWQNKRNSEAFSFDGGKMYYLLSENETVGDPANFSYHEAEVTGKRHKSWDHPEDDHSEHVHVAPSALPPSPAIDPSVNLDVWEPTSQPLEWDIDRNQPAEIIEHAGEFERELRSLINRHSLENESGTPDFILAMFLTGQMDLFNVTIQNRAAWRGESVELPALQGSRPLEGSSDLQQGGFEAGDTLAPGALEGNDGKEVPLVTYESGQRNEIGTAVVKVTPGEIRVEGKIIEGAEAMFADPDASFSIDEPKDEPLPENRKDVDPFEVKSAFRRYQEKGLTDNGEGRN